MLYLFLGVSIMTGVGGAVHTGHAHGAGDPYLAGQWFSLTTALAAGIVGLLTAACFLFFEPLLNLLNSDPALQPPLRTYLGSILVF